MRRSRLVARAYNVLDTREDVHAPASSSICNRLLPAVIMSELCGDTAIMGALDISDAYLQVDQPTPKKKIVSLIVQMRITLFIGAYLDSVMALVVGMIIFQILCKQSWVVKFVPNFFFIIQTAR